MRVFIALKVPRGDPAREQVSALLAEQVRQAGHTPFVAWEEIVRAGLSTPAEFMPFVRGAIAESGLLLAAYHPELRGGLIEMGIAYAGNVPIWLLHPAGGAVSSSALGCASRVIAYADFDDLRLQLQENFRNECFQRV